MHTPAGPTPVPQRRELGGLITFVTPQQVEYGRCGLVIARGLAHERLSRVGWLELLLANACDDLDDLGVLAQVTVGVDRSKIDIVGTPQQAAKALQLAADRLAAPDPDNLAMLRELTLAATADDELDEASEALARRFGANGPALLGARRFGLHRQGLAGIVEQAVTAFATGNVRAYFDFEPPPGWTTKLPPGPRLLPDRPVSATLVPAWYHSGGRHTTVSGVVPRSYGATAFAQLLRDDLMARLRTELHEVYAAQVAYHRADADKAVITAVVDIPSERSAALVRTVLDVVHQRCWPFDPADLGRLLHTARVARLHGAKPWQAARAAAERDFEDPPGELNWDDRGWEQISVEDVRGAAQSFVASLMIGLPRVAAGRASGLTEAGLLLPAHPDQRTAEGVRQYFSTDPGETSRLFIANNTLFEVEEGQLLNAVALTDVALALRTPDGALTLFQNTGQRMVIDPAAWKYGPELIEKLVPSVDPDVVLHADPEAI